MPRRPPQSPNPDDWAAWRVGYERERHGWSIAELARRVSAAGAPIQHQAIWQIENRQPPRRISVGEAIALCRVFGFDDVSELGKPPEEATGQVRQELAAAFREWELLTNDVLRKARHIRAEIARITLGPGSWPEEMLGDLGSVVAELEGEIAALQSEIEAARESGRED